MPKTSTLFLVLVLFLMSCDQGASTRRAPVLPDIDISGSENGIVPLPDDVDEVFKVFNRYTKVVAPNGKPIHIVIEEGYTNEQAVHSRRILEQHLTAVPSVSE